MPVVGTCRILLSAFTGCISVQRRMKLNLHNCPHRHAIIVVVILMEVRGFYRAYFRAFLAAASFIPFSTSNPVTASLMSDRLLSSTGVGKGSGKKSSGCNSDCMSSRALSSYLSWDFPLLTQTARFFV